MRILIPTIDYPPIEGGISTVCLQLARVLAERGHEVVVVAPWFPEMHAFDHAEPYTVVRFRGYGWGWLRLFTLLAATRRHMRPGDLLLAINIAYGGIAGWMLGARYVCFAYAYEFLKFSAVPPLRGLLRRVYAGAAGTVAISDFTRASLADFGVAENTITVAYPGAESPPPADAAHQETLRRRLGIPPGPVVLAVGRFIPRKNHRVLVEAWPRVLERIPDAQLVMAGRGPERDRCVARAQALGVADTVHCAGYLDVEDIAQLYHACDVFALPNGEDANGHVEGFGLVFAEAAACGRPVIAGDSGGAREAVLHGETGYLVPPGDADALAEALIRLLTDGALRERLGNAGRARVAEELNWERFADGVLRSAGAGYA
ncbi:MAG: glycosyltransferase [Candidatus Hydrogenedens sp.]|nr:glycosyltransferase [Candidatus Hydrogenedens sp.]